MNYPPKISIITPSYNQGQFIEETILSVIKQNYTNIEYLIVDGGSTDNTLEIIKKYEHRITYWVIEKDNGQSDAINKGFKKATGDIICWINSDDILMPNALKTIANYFNNNKDVGLANGYTLRIDQNSNILYNHFILKQKHFYARNGLYYLAQPSMFWRKGILDEIGLIREDFHAQMDKEFLIRVFQKGIKIGRINKILAAIRIHEDSKTYINGNIWQNDSIKIKSIYGKKYGLSPNIVIKSLYGVEKLLKLLYFKQIIFSMKWKGKKVDELNANNCIYIR